MKALKTDKKETKSTRWSFASCLYRRIQRTWVRFMERFTLSLSRRGLTACLICFVVIGVTYNILILTGYMVSEKIKVDGIQAPRYVEQPYEMMEKVVLKSKKRQIKALRGYLDSLASTPESRPLYDSILTKYPGLLDSLIKIEEQYK